MQKISTTEIRAKFLAHMKKNGHAIIPSSTLVPENDPTTLFTGSGMQPMLPYLLGQKHPLGVRIADSQKCFRSQDIEEVGDNRHTTFFEMLGNWSLGDFFKSEQIDIMWDFLVNEIKLDPARLYFSVYRGNDTLGIGQDVEAITKWQDKFKSVGIDAKVGQDPEKNGIQDGERVFAYPDKKNWWSRSGVPENMPVGEPGGPDTEMFFDFDPENKIKTHENSQWSAEKCHVNCDCGRYVEIGNNVFMQYMRTGSGVEELKQKNVDFGGGLERMAAAVNGDSDVFNLDVFDNAKNILEKISGLKYENQNVYAYRVILDHMRAATFLVGDGVFPGNKDQQYFVRRLIRRAVRFAKKLNISENFTMGVVQSFVDVYCEEYKNLKEKEIEIKKIIDDEETKFRKTLEVGLKEFEKYSTANITAPDAFNLLQSFGFPVELTEELAKEKGLSVDMEGFKILKDAHSEASRTASSGKFKGGLGGDSEIETKYHTATHMLHKALHMVLGEGATQKGSNITTERLRFDFSFDRKLTPEEIKKVEDTVNENIQKNLSVTRSEVTLEEAKNMGAIGLFGDKYGERVSVYSVEGFSLELCGGPHVTHTGDMGVFKIVKEEAVSAGVRRIKATLS